MLIRSLLILLVVSLLPADLRALDYRIETVASNLEFPWCLAFLPNGDMLVTERPGRLRRIDAQGTLSEPIAGVPATYVASQGGLFDVLLDPDFETTRRIYLSFAHGTPGANATRVIRARLEENVLEDLQLVTEVTPNKDTPVHYGGRIAWQTSAQSGAAALLITTGDGFNFREAAQDKRSQLGKILRLQPNGAVAPDNPFIDADDANPMVYSYGHRNPQGLAVDPENGRIYANEHGPRGGDELNVIEPGRNYGWPIISYGHDYTGALITPFTARPGLEQPLVQWTPSIGASGMAIYRGTMFPDWQGDLFVGALVERSVRRIDMDNGRVVGQEVLFRELDERIRDVRVGPDGYLYLLTDSDNGRVLRVLPTTE
jgi:glucose/arabinose dehydrogenase